MKPYFNMKSLIMRTAPYVMCLFAITAVWRLVLPGQMMGPQSDVSFSRNAVTEERARGGEPAPDEKGIGRDGADIAAAMIAMSVIFTLLAVGVKEWKKSTEGKLLVAFLCQLFVYILFTWLLPRALDDSADDFFVKFGGAAGVWAFATSLHMILASRGAHEWIKIREKHLYLLYLPAAVFMGLFFTHYIIGGVSYMPRGVIPIHGDAHKAYKLFLVSYYTAGVLAIIHSYRRSKGVDRNRALFLAIAFLFPVFAILAADAVLAAARFDAPVRAAALCFCAMTATYALLRERPVDLPFLIGVLVKVGKRRFNRRLKETAARLPETATTRGEVEEALSRVLGCDAVIDTRERSTCAMGEEPGRGEVDAPGTPREKPPPNRLIFPGESDRAWAHLGEAGVEGIVVIPLDSRTRCVLKLGPGVRTNVLSNRAMKNLETLWSAVKMCLKDILNEEAIQNLRETMEQRLAQSARRTGRLEKRLEAQKTEIEGLRRDAARASDLERDLGALKTEREDVRLVAARASDLERDLEREREKTSRIEKSLEELKIELDEKKSAITRSQELKSRIVDGMKERTAGKLSEKDAEIKALQHRLENEMAKEKARGIAGKERTEEALKEARRVAKRTVEEKEAEIEEQKSAARQLEKEKRTLIREIDGLTHDYLETPGIHVDASNEKRRLRVLQLGASLRCDLADNPSIEPLFSNSWEEAFRLIKEKKVDVVVPFETMLDAIDIEGAPSLEIPILVASIDPSIRKKFAALFPGSLIGFVNQRLKDGNHLAGTARVITEIQNATLYKNETHRLISRATSMIRLVKRVEEIARIEAVKIIFLQGETGTGKELLAGLIHQLRPPGPFIVLPCNEISGDMFGARLYGSDKGDYTSSIEVRKGAIERATGGTLFLDELGMLMMADLSKLLRVVEWGSYMRLGGKSELIPKALFVCATNRDAGDPEIFPADLYHRVGEGFFTIPPLSEREGDVELLMYHFLWLANDKYSKSCQLSKKLVESMKDGSCPFPGNVRELSQLMHKAVGLSKKNALIKYLDFPDEKPPLNLDLHKQVALSKTLVIEQALGRAAGNLTRAARLLNVDRSTLNYQIGKLKMS